ncbi:MAG TPA: type I pullulanase [Chitinophagaceae bacterium]|nr:type I pullulanase [Chitinophagaceae bacterium]HPG11350.1 type I pullulanase [Chitinophagaceae bacterium]
MKRFIMVIGFLNFLFHSKAQWPDFNKYPEYAGNDLGLTYTAQESVFKIWSPPADKAELLYYNSGADTVASETHAMQKSNNGTWVLKIKGDQKGKFYCFRVRIKNKWHDAVPDPYAKAVGINGKKAMVVDLHETNPLNWQQDISPEFKKETDAIIYELHVRDASISPLSGIINKGKFLGLTEKGTTNPDGLSTGLDHIKELGVTHVHLLPVYDFYSIDETSLHPNYNWGYDPQNYNVPEGSYSTNPYDGITRIKEFKQLIQTFHQNGLRVVMDVVYNHTRLTEESNFSQLVPGYYYRQTKDGKFSNATGCGNETASERPMFRKFMLESMKYWVQEYHIDGFRVDLMGVHDIETMNLVSKELHELKPDILIYGEGWTAGSSPIPDSLRALKTNVAKLDRIAVFSDDIRDGIKGSWHDILDKGFVAGDWDKVESVKFGIVASCKHPQVDYQKINNSKAPYAKDPSQTISYCSCHDNHTLWDKLFLSATSASPVQLIEMHKLALSIVLTSQGIAFLHAGTEMLRSKKMVENSFESPDSINAIDWGGKTSHKEVFEYIKALVKLRKEHPAFRIAKGEDLPRDIVFRNNLPANILSYTINGEPHGDKWKKIQVFFNVGAEQQEIIGTADWSVAVLNNHLLGEKDNKISSVRLQPYSCTIMYQQ